MEHIRTLTDTLGFTTKQPEQISWCLSIMNFSQNIILWIQNNPSFCVMVICLSVIIYLFCKYYNVKFNVTKKKKPKINKSENFCRMTVEKLFNKPFPSIRPNWLNNQKTQRNMELDMYNDNMKLAFEYQGIQHYEFNKFFHKSLDDFEKQKDHDKVKKEICKNNGVTLIDVPYHIKKEKMKDYIINECKKNNISCN